MTDTSFEPELYERQLRAEGKAAMTKMSELLDSFINDVPKRVRESPRFQAWVAALKEMRDGESKEQRERRLRYKLGELYG